MTKSTIAPTDHAPIDMAKLRQTSDLDRFNEMGMAVNLDEVSPEQIEVAFVEYAQVTSAEGQLLMRPNVRIAKIWDFVPMYLFNRLIAAQRHAQRLKNRIEAGDVEEPEEDPQIMWIIKQVLAVWQLTEEDMTLERLQKGLDFDRIYGLFVRFFGSQLRRLNGRA
jgi:hypothetical protein